MMQIPNLLEIISALEEGQTAGKTASNLFKDEVNQDKIQLYLDEYPEKVSELKTLAEKHQAKPIQVLQYSSYKQFDTTGARDDYQDEYFEHRERLTVMAMCVLLFGDEIYVNETENIIWAICDEYTWCLPAHLHGQSLINQTTSEMAAAIDGKITGTAYKHRHVLDLFACETARELAEMLHFAGDQINPQVRDRAVESIIERVFSQYLLFNRIHHFEVDLSNWSAVCGGSLGVAALYLINDADVLAPVIQRVISDLDVFLMSYGEDGIGREGVGYWYYGFYNFSYFAWLLRERTKGKLDLFQDPKVKKVAFFPAHAFLYQDACVNFSDCSSRGRFSRDLAACLRQVYADMPEATALSLDDIKGERDVPITPRKIAWHMPLKAAPFRERSDFFPDAGWLISCKKWQGKAVSFVIKGGHNDEPHNHNDLGHFILMVDDEQLLCDLGSGEYTKDYFGPARYSYLVNASEGHSVPIIEGQFQKTGAKSVAHILNTSTNEQIDTMTMDFSSAYSAEGLERLVRQVKVNKTGFSVSLEDTFQSVKHSVQVTERFVSLIKPEIVSSQDIIINGQKASVSISSIHNPVSINSSRVTFKKPGRKTDTAWLIDFEFCLDHEQNKTVFDIKIL